MVNVVIILLPLCSLVFTCVHTASVNTTDRSASQGNAVVARLRISGSNYWTEWYDVDDPDTGTGDYETVDAITSVLGTNICPNTHSITNAKCRVDNDDDDVNSDDRGDNLHRSCSPQGLICLKKDQHSGRCNNYQIRFYCDQNEDGEGGNNGQRNSVSRFDMRIYIILAAVPIAIFVLRICWSCTFEKRRRRLRQIARARRQTGHGESIDPEVFMPPPSYQELFGENGEPFSLSRHYTLCTKCKVSRCAIFKNRSRNSLPQNSQIPQSGSVNNSEVVDTTAAEPSPENPATSATESSGSTHPESQSGSTDRDDSPTISTRCGNSEPQVSSQTVEASQCDCPCHKRAPEVVMAFDNPAYSPEVEIQDGRSSRFPGMHLSVFSLFRSPSASSEPPPPTYREALKILKKNQGNQ